MRRVLLPALPAFALLVPSADCCLSQYMVPPGGDRDRRCFAELQQQASLRDTTPTFSQLERLDGLADDGAVVAVHHGWMQPLLISEDLDARSCVRPPEPRGSVVPVLWCTAVALSERGRVRSIFWWGSVACSRARPACCRLPATAFACRKAGFPHPWCSCLRRAGLWRQVAVLSYQRGVQPPPRRQPPPWLGPLP